MKKRRLRRVVRRVADAAGVPVELLGRGRMVVVGFEQVYIEGHTGIGTCTPARVDVHFAGGTCQVVGRDLVLTHLSREAIAIRGQVRALVREGEHE